MSNANRSELERRFVEKTLGNRVICKQCGATLTTYADACNADLAEACPGFLVVEQAKQAFKEER